MEKLALHGGPMAKPTPYNLPNKYGTPELDKLEAVMRSGRLMGTGGKVARLRSSNRKSGSSTERPTRSW